MYKLTLLLIPLILLSSCTLDLYDDIDSSINECNRIINEARSHRDGSYEEINSALHELNICYYQVSDR